MITTLLGTFVWVKDFFSLEVIEKSENFALATVGVVNGKSKTCRDCQLLKSETKTEKFSD